jgi:hypothetical protein
MDMKTQNWPSAALNPVGLIIRQKDPNNLEMPFDQLGEFITPSELFTSAVISPYRSSIRPRFDCRYGVRYGTS